MWRKLCCVALLLGLQACSSTPTVFNQKLDNAPTLAEVIAAPDPQPFAGQKVRWGGELISVRNQSDATWLEVLELPLKDSGVPREGDDSAGRFFIKVSGFLDPKVYEAGELLTGVGYIDGYVTQKVGEFDYKYPVVLVDVADQRIWPPQSKPKVSTAISLGWPWGGYYRYPRIGTRVIFVDDSNL